MRLNHEALGEMPDRKRAALINSVSGFKSANLIGTASGDGQHNLAIMSSVVHIGSHPPLLALIVRPGGEERHTLANILKTEHYSINHVANRMIEAAHQTAARYPQHVSEFEATGLSPEWWPNFDAPLVAEASVKLAMQLRDHQELTINGTHLVIGEVIQLDVPDNSVNDDFSLDLIATGTTALTGLDSYHSAQLEKKMAYAKPDLPPRSIP
jgi:flavin reductase (DIM6/NTAB) family NADH-FMN oxidoreductase RutF